MQSRLDENLQTSQDISAKEGQNGNLYVTSNYSHSISTLRTPMLELLCITLADNVRKRKAVESSNARWGSGGKMANGVGRACRNTRRKNCKRKSKHIKLFVRTG